MEWPSKNIAPGGILHPAKTQYSHQTHEFLKVLMEESKLSMMQRKKMDYILRNGEPLPTPSASTGRRRSNLPPITIRPGSSKRRSKNTIVSSGAYEREKFRPTSPVIDREKEKEKLANKMAYNKEINVTKDKIIKKLENEEVKVEPNRFDELMDEIKERQDWLKEMEKLGHAEKYRLIIEQQIDNKMREMRKLKPAPKQCEK